MIEDWEKCKSCARKELESLIGTLQHACAVICPGRSFMRNAIPLVKGAKQPHHHIHLSVELRSDLVWWKLFAASWNGTALIIPLGSAQHVFTSDAPGLWGCGAWLKNNWFSPLYIAHYILLLRKWYQSSLQC